MKDNIWLKPNVNKKNGQINLSLPKKQLSKEIIKEIKSNNKIKIKILR
jgi:hypothetical protein